MRTSASVYDTTTSAPATARMYMYVYKLVCNNYCCICAILMAQLSRRFPTFSTTLFMTVIRARDIRVGFSSSATATTANDVPLRVIFYVNNTYTRSLSHLPRLLFLLLLLIASSGVVIIRLSSMGKTEWTRIPLLCLISLRPRHTHVYTYIHARALTAINNCERASTGHRINNKLETDELLFFFFLYFSIFIFAIAPPCENFYCAGSAPFRPYVVT